MNGSSKSRTPLDCCRLDDASGLQERVTISSSSRLWSLLLQQADVLMFSVHGPQQLCNSSPLCQTLMLS